MEHISSTMPTNVDFSLKTVANRETGSVSRFLSDWGKKWEGARGCGGDCVVLIVSPLKLRICKSYIYSHTRARWHNPISGFGGAKRLPVCLALSDR